MRAIRIFLGLLAATVALATAGTAAAEDIYTCPVEDVIGFRKMEEGLTADNKFGWAMDVVEMTMMLHISSVYAADTPLNTSMYMYTGKCS